MCQCVSVCVCVQFARFVLGETRHAQESFAVLVADAIVAGETTTLAHCGSAARLEWESRLNRDIANTHRHTHSRTMRLRAMGDGEEVVDEYREGHGPAQRTFNREQRRNSDIALSLSALLLCVGHSEHHRQARTSNCSNFVHLRKLRNSRPAPPRFRCCVCVCFV